MTDDLIQRLEDEAAAGAAAQAQPPSDVPSGEGPVPDAAAGTAPAPQTPDGVEIGGQRYTAAELEPYVRAMNWATQDRARWEQILAWERRGYVSEPSASAPAAPPAARDAARVPEEDDDYVDPRVRALEERLQSYEAALEERQHLEDRAAIDQGLADFLTQHQDLSDDDRNEVLVTARDWALVAAAVEREPNPARRAQAVRQAFEHAWRIAFFDRAGQAAASSAVTNITRARRAATATSSRPTPRSQPPPKVETPRDLENALARDIAEAMEANR